MDGLWAQNISVHDPVMIKEKDTYYLYCTGKGISVFSSKDMKTWSPEPSVFKEKPTWAAEVVPDFDNHIWAPDISYHNNTYYLYYSVSAFGKNTSAIGVVTNTTLNRKDKDYKWIDKGIVVRSYPNRDQWNAIDPNLIIDENNTPWLVFGSFWDGIKMFKLNPDLVSIAEPQEWNAVARRSAGNNSAIEAPFIFKKNGYFYLFASWDFCCKGEESTYKVVVGRSVNVTGPYVDKENKPLTEGGGTLLIQGDKNYHGVGHNSVYTFEAKDYIVCHAYDAKQKGKPVLKINQLKWDEALWPIVETSN